MAAQSGGEDAELLPAKRAKLEVPLEPPYDSDDSMVSNRIVLLLCGSFSPITNLHLRMLGEFQIEFLAVRAIVGITCSLVHFLYYPIDL